ncbi:MAG: dihydroorotate dehydrogenase [Nitrospira sp.]|nr:dihydroorotate dehydrogenase [Candidatus Manganitrophaceae bacterium]HIL34709.1 dihydroorotate dehydrogenase [Candidatus Manganitrophaceae bacterium]
MKPMPAYDVDRSYEANYREGPFIKEKAPVRQIRRKERFLGFEVNSRLGIPAGPLLNARWILAYAAMGFDLLVYKTVRTCATPSHPKPNCMFLGIEDQIREVDFEKQLVATMEAPSDLSRISITNSFGMPSRAPEVWQADIQKAKEGLSAGQVLIVSVVGTPGEKGLEADYVQGATLAVEAGAPIIEINLSCPNVVTGEGSLYTDPESSSAISRAVKRAIGDVPLMIKIGYIPDPKRLAEVVGANAPHIEAIAGVNTLSFEVVGPNGTQALPGKGRLRAGVCGAAIRQCAMEQAARIVDLKRKVQYDFEVVGVGGVMTPEHIRSYLSLGVDAVMSATGAMWDPLLASRFWSQV